MTVFLSKTEGQFAPLFWTMVVTCFVIPFALLANHRTRWKIWGVVTASVSVEIGMWLERFLIVVPSLSQPRLPLTAAVYTPSWVEWSLFAAFVAMFILLYAVFTKLFPIVSIWEIREGREHSVREVVTRVESYLPGPTETGDV
jgi:molybdopterin-containing oxidoreductase family membrane subunit